MKLFGCAVAALIGLQALTMTVPLAAHDDDKERRGGNGNGEGKNGKHLFERETFGGNGRTCSTCHSDATGTVSPEDAQRRFHKDPDDPLFRHDGSDDFQGNGVARMLKDATVLVEIPLPPNVSLADDPAARSVVLRRGIPSTLNTPALDPVLMQDGRQPSLEAQAMGALHDHAQATSNLTGKELARLIAFEKSDAFFSSPALRRFADHGPAPVLPEGITPAQQRGKRFFEDVVDFADLKHGACAACHSGPMLNETNDFAQIVFGLPKGTRFQTVGVSELNALQNPVHDYIFTSRDGIVSHVVSPDPGRALITGIAPTEDPRFENVNAFKTPTLWGIRHTAPYFHDNSAKTLEAVAAHYNAFFSFTSDPDGPGPLPPLLSLSADDQADIVAYMKLLQ